MKTKGRINYFLMKIDENCSMEIDFWWKSFTCVMSLYFLGRRFLFFFNTIAGMGGPMPAKIPRFMATWSAENGHLNLKLHKIRVLIPIKKLTKVPHHGSNWLVSGGCGLKYEKSICWYQLDTASGPAATPAPKSSSLNEKELLRSISGVNFLCPSIDFRENKWGKDGKKGLTGVLLARL